MNKAPVIAIFDIGKTNKKLVVFDQDYQIIFQESVQFPEILDEDGFASEDLTALVVWIQSSLDRLITMPGLDLTAVNFSTYGASLVHVNQEGEVIAPLYNYLKPFPQAIQLSFYEKFGGEIVFSKSTASPVLGNLNAGLQLYRLKYQQPQLFNRIRYALHLPQYLSSLLTRKAYSDITSIGCHSGLWDFANNDYHDWVYQENIRHLLARIFPSDQIEPSYWKNHKVVAGIGLHDSSAALIPYELFHDKPFILISTGTWCISLNPFNNTPLTAEELARDCLCYLDYKGKRVKASRLFAGHEHEQQVKRLAEYFNKPLDHYKKIDFDLETLSSLSWDRRNDFTSVKSAMIRDSAFGGRALSIFDNYAQAYHQFMLDLIGQQVFSTRLVLEGTSIKFLFVDGGFSRNSVYMHLLAMALPQMQVFAAVVPEASAMGAALAVHPYWNKKYIPSDLISIKPYFNIL